jgi:CelD/BcsL family acetyltransferase involved in cellulose biosynthesis
VYDRFFVDLTGSFEDYLQKFSSKSRYTLKRSVRKLLSDDKTPVPWQQFTTPEEMDRFYTLAMDVSRKTYQHRLLDVGLPDGDDFRRKMAQSAAGRVRGYILYHEHKPIAYVYCPITEERVLLCAHVGYDPEFSSSSPGTALQYLILESLFKEARFSMFDFTEGEGQLKKFFATASRKCADVFYFRPRLRILLCLAMHSALYYVSRSITRFLALNRVKNLVRRFIRSKA